MGLQSYTRRQRVDDIWLIFHHISIVIVHVPCFSQLPYTQQGDMDKALGTMTHSADVSALRNQFGADLVHLIGAFADGAGTA